MLCKLINFADLPRINGFDLQRHVLLVLLRDGRFAEIKIYYEEPGVVKPLENLYALAPNGHVIKIENITLGWCGQPQKVNLQGDITVELGDV
jgi:hypothetical protein